LANEPSAPTWPPRSAAAELPDVLLSAFARIGAIRIFGRGQVLMAEQATTSEVYLIVGGFVRVINHSASGVDAMIAIRTRGDLVGELAAMDGQPRTSTVIAASRVSVRVIDALLFRSFMTAHPSVAEAVSRSVVGKLRGATRSLADASGPSVFARVARVLDHLADSYGRPTTAGVLIDIPLPQRDLASLAGTSEKGVSRAYAVLRAQKVIGVTYRRVVVRDPVALQRYAADTFEPGRGLPGQAAQGRSTAGGALGLGAEGSGNDR
jgi:CRP-like cAMP-binding protein